MRQKNFLSIIAIFLTFIIIISSVSTVNAEPSQAADTEGPPVSDISLYVSADNSDEYDLYHISEQELEMLKPKNKNNQIVKIYLISGIWELNSTKSITEIIESASSHNPTYIEIRNGNIVSVQWYNKNTSKVIVADSAEYLDKELLFMLLTNSDVFSLPQGTEIISKYFFRTSNPYDGTIIYFKTNKGNYIYVDGLRIGGAYMFPEKELRDFLKVAFDMTVDYYEKHPSEVGYFPISDIWDLSPYKVYRTNETTTTRNESTSAKDNITAPTHDGSSIDTTNDALEENLNSRETVAVCVFAGVILVIAVAVIVKQKKSK